MWLWVLLAVLIVLALGGGAWGHSRHAYWGWSPAAIVLVVLAVLFFTGQLSLHH